MRIKSLQVHGFKSFVDRTVFNFKGGITAVVGPNGCGKSNVVDAVRWVMGEQSARRLRGKGMEDVIFAGSESRPPIGMAEVVLTFDNRDGTAPAAFSAYSEIQVTRRLYRSGESEYRLNKTACRLRDVQDFFRDTGFGVKGYTIVEQGRIAEIVSAKADERRILIEEAAGISKYKARRREAESKISSTEQNLVRVTDVLGEIKRQISSLERQARKAARYKRLRETLRVLELSLAVDERKDLMGALDASKAKLQEAHDQVTALETQLSERELSVEEKRIALAEAEKAVTQGAELLYGLRSEIKQIEGQIDWARRETAGLEEANEGRSQELEQLTEQLTHAEREALECAEELQQLETALAGEAETVASSEEDVRAGSEGLRELEREREEANEALVGVLTYVARTEDRAAAVADRRSEIDLRLRAADQQLELHQSEAAQADTDQSNLETGLRNLFTERERFNEQMVRALRTQEEAATTARETNARLRELREKTEARKARFDSLREVVERNDDVGGGAKSLLARDDETRRRLGLRGIVREVVEVDREVELAAEAVLAECSEAIVMESAQGAIEALADLRASGAGRGVFVAKPPVDTPALGTVPLGEPLLERVRPRPGFEDVVRIFFADVYLVSSLGDALEAYGSGRLPATFVTRDGDVLSPDGLIRGGGESVASGSIARVREVRELEIEVVSLVKSIEQCESETRAAEAALQLANDELDNLRNRHHTAALAVANHEKDLERTRDRVKSIGEAQEGRVAERSELLAESEALVGEQERLHRDLEESRTERGNRQRELDSLGLKISGARRDVARFENQLTELRVAHSSRVETRDRLRETVERAGSTANETREWIERRRRDIASAEERRDELAQQITDADRELTGQLEAEEEARVAVEQRRAVYEGEAEATRGLEDEVRDVRGNLNGVREQSVSTELAVREAELQLRHLDEGIRERWEVELATWTPPVVDREVEIVVQGEVVDGGSAPGVIDEGAEAVGDDADGEEGRGEDVSAGDAAAAAREALRNAELARAPREEREAELERVRKGLQSLGDVNLGAIEEHEELTERFRFLGEQREDLENTIQSLREAIARINRTSRRRFRETFEAVSKRFSENFPRMFGGGKASLELTESEDILESGIDIVAQPPGKRLQNVNLLSGGEKTMTAIALLVAVFQVRPSPFFLLDEVDAALDDANVGRFNQLIGEMSADSQFLVITHNKRTIEVSDILYGVTMEQQGVSKLVAVELDD